MERGRGIMGGHPDQVRARMRENVEANVARSVRAAKQEGLPSIDVGGYHKPLGEHVVFVRNHVVHKLQELDGEYDVIIPLHETQNKPQAKRSDPQAA